jgi:DnaJ-class molecular chaperone
MKLNLFKKFSLEFFKKHFKNFLEKIQLYKLYDFLYIGIVEQIVKKLITNYGKINDYELYKRILSTRNFEKSKLWDENIFLEIDINLITALSKKRYEVFYKRILKCENCKDKKFEIICECCNSKGFVETLKNNYEICRECYGYGGYSQGHSCEICKNMLFYQKSTSVILELDSSFYNGMTYVFSGMGNYNCYNGQYGFLKIRPKLVSDTTAEGIQLNISSMSTIESKELVPLHLMMLGGIYDVSHSLGKCSINLEPATQPGSYKVINNVGIPSYYDEEENEIRKGPQIVYLHLKIPDLKLINSNPYIKQLFIDLQNHDSIKELNELNRVDYRF